MGRLDKDQIEKYLMDRMNKLTQKYLASKTESLGKFSSSLVETLNDELPKKCPSVEGFKYVVHATVQVGWSLGRGTWLANSSIVCLWKRWQDFRTVRQSIDRTHWSLSDWYISVQDNYGQGSLLGGQCQWDPSTDDFVKANLQLQKLSLGAVVFFVSIDDEEGE